MKAYIVRRILESIPTLLIISFMIFSLLYITPGDPVALILGTEDLYIPPAQRAIIEREWGLDQPFLVRYVRFVTRAFTGDLGTSFATGLPVFESVMERMPATLTLTFWSIIMALCISVPLGTLAAIKHNSIWDSLATALATIGVSLPTFWFALVLIILFSLRPEGGLPSHGAVTIADAGIVNYFRHLILPVSSLALSMSALQTRMVRSSMLDVLNQDYVRYARSKGLQERSVIYSHAFKNAMIPVITVFGASIGALLGGAVITEHIFSWPGVGRLAVSSIGRRDFPMIQGITFLLCMSYIFVNLIVDIVYALVDPRIRLDKKN